MARFLSGWRLPVESYRLAARHAALLLGMHGSRLRPAVCCRAVPGGASRICLAKDVSPRHARRPLDNVPTIELNGVGSRFCALRKMINAVPRSKTTPRPLLHHKQLDNGPEREIANDQTRDDRRYPRRQDR